MTARQMRMVGGRVITGCIAAGVLSVIAFRLHFNLSSATSIHLFLVVVVALRWGFLEAGILSIFSVACLDFFFTEPVFAFFITDSHDWVALVTFEAAALLVSRLSNQVKSHAQQSELHQQQLQKLYELSQHILLLDRMSLVEQQIADLMRANLKVEGVALWNALDAVTCTSGRCPLSEEEIRSVTSDMDDLATGVSHRILRSGTRTIGSLVLCGHALDPASMNAAASLASVAIERSRSFSTEANAEAARQSEQLRSAILDGLAHAFKSPLTTIMVSSSGLLAMNTLSGVEKKLVGLIDRHASQLSDLTNHLLLTASLDKADLKTRREDIDLAQLLEGCVEACAQELAGHMIELQVVATHHFISGDRKLLQMALLQILDNAVKYGTPGSPLVLSVTEDTTEIAITVKNEGSFIPEHEREKVFERFYRCSSSSRSISGTGIGLSVVRRIAEAHHGRASVESDRIAGTTFAITLPHIPGRNSL